MKRTVLTDDADRTAKNRQRAGMAIENGQADGLDLEKKGGMENLERRKAVLRRMMELLKEKQ